MGKFKTALIAACLGVMALPAGAGPAAAAPAGLGATQADGHCLLEVPAWNTGYLLGMDCSSWARAEWNSDGSRPEYFAVAANRTVWHAWPGSGGWRQVPGNKSADDIINGTVGGKRAWWWSGGARHVSIWVTGGTGYWCTSDLGSGWTGVWRDC
ncbi:hypothetical protein [Saccharothrix sp. HUAS TT1]|uniref:hypothetical protein n=1 Tax=unclassified Saccharothrix TaxID=2593673 RepID=UPI00345C5D1A